MIDERLIDKLVEVLVDRIEQGNSYVLQKIGESINKIGTLSPSKAQQLGQILKYGGNYDKIVKKLSEITKLNVKEIYEIFEQVAKSDYAFAKRFYDYKQIKYIPYEQNVALQNQVKALARITAGEYLNYSKTLAFTKKVNGRVVYTELARTYQETIDKAVLSVAQGKTTFDEQMYSTIKDLGSSGVKTVDYASGRAVRLDSSVRQHMKGALRNLHNEIQEIVGEEFGADMVEISVHENPAPDHYMQGIQVSLEEYEKMQSHLPFKDLNNNTYEPLDRPISEYNCYHYVFYGVAGVSKPNYSDEELKEILRRNNEGVEIDGKKYTKYQVSQIQRLLERKIREQKDLQIIGRASGNVNIINNAQQKITQLSHKYKEISDKAGLPYRKDRLRVSQYRRINTKKL
jgi:hypothetical protein